MKDTSTPRNIRLTEYLIERGVGADLDAQAAIFAKIFSGALPAFLTVHPELPAGASARDIQNYARSEAREVSVLEIPSVKVELRKAALGQDASWTVLDRISVRAPGSESSNEAIAKPVQREAAHKENILYAIRDLGHSPTCLPPTPRGKSGIKRIVRDHLREKGSRIEDGAFNKAWQALRDEKSIKEA